MRVFTMLMAGALGLGAQTVINGGRTIIGSWDASGAAKTLPFQTGPTANLPASCTAGQMYFETDGAPGRRIQSCTAANTWAAAAYDQGISLPAACAVGQVYFKTDAAAGQNLYFCTSTNTWTQMAAGGSSGSSYYQTMIGAGALAGGSNNTGRTQRAAMQARDNFGFEDDGTNTILNWTPLDARTVWLDEEFPGTNLTNAAIGNLGWRYFNIAGTSTGPVQAADGTWPNLGVMQWTTGTTAGNGFDLTLNGNGGGSGQLGALGGNAGWGFIWIFRLGSASAVRLYIGSGNVASGIVTFDPLNAWGLRYDTHAGIADTNFQFYARGASGADVTLDTGVAGDTTWHTLLVYSAVAGTIRFSLDGGAEKAFCAAGCDNAAMTIPAAQMDPFVMLETDTSAARVIELDAFKFKARVSANTANRRN